MGSSGVSLVGAAEGVVAAVAAVDPQTLSLAAGDRAAALRISARQMDRRLKAQKTQRRRSIYGRTKPGYLLKHHIPLQTDRWDVHQPGFAEVDLVSHSGNSASGEFAYSLNLTDVHTGWTETRAMLGRAARRSTGFGGDPGALPFRCGGSIPTTARNLSTGIWRAGALATTVQFTHSRPYKKDDNAHIEQKNWTHVRKLMGWDRYDTPRRWKP